MSKGIVLFAHNNDTIDYVAQAVFCCKKIKEHLKLPVTLITSENVKEDVFDKFGVYPEKVIDVQSLAGDSVDNIPGSTQVLLLCEGATSITLEPDSEYSVLSPFQLTAPTAMVYLLLA